MILAAVRATSSPTIRNSESDQERGAAVPPTGQAVPLLVEGETCWWEELRITPTGSGVEKLDAGMVKQCRQQL